jgi:hypothetical protein
LIDESLGEVKFPEAGPGMREMNRDEVLEMAKYLEIEPSELRGPFLVDKNLICPNCGRHSTFLDFIKTAVDAQLHDKELVRAVLSGRAGRFITIRGKVADRTLVCVKCQRARRLQNAGDCNYEGRWYRYG